MLGDWITCRTRLGRMTTVRADRRRRNTRLSPLANKEPVWKPARISAKNGNYVHIGTPVEVSAEHEASEMLPLVRGAEGWLHWKTAVWPHWTGGCRSLPSAETRNARAPAGTSTACLCVER